MAMPKLLYIDDAESNLFVVELIADEQGYEFETATTMAEGLRKVEASEFQLILCDIRLPDGDGFQILEHIRRIKTNAFTPVIAFTADVTVATRDRIIFDGFTDYITKPFKADDLTTRLSLYLKPLQVLPDLSYYLPFIKDEAQLTKIKATIKSDFQSFEKALFYAWQQKNYEAIREQIHRIEFICENLKLTQLTTLLIAMRAEDAFTQNINWLIIETKCHVLKVYQGLAHRNEPN